MRFNLIALAVLCALGFASAAEAKKPKWVEVPLVVDAGNLPTCLDRNRQPIRGDNNDEVLRWKEETKNQYKDRALIDGVLVSVLLDRRSHLHLEVNLEGDERSTDPRQHIEIVYNKAFGEVGDLQPGMPVQACGDYITSREQSGPYKPSPVGAIVHWVHKSNTPDRHSHGFLAIDGKLYGMEDDKNRRDRRDQRDQRQQDQEDESDWEDFRGFLGFRAPAFL
jgi:hypothetical protein